MIGPTGARDAAALNTTAWGYCFAAHLFNGFPEPDVRWAEQSLTLFLCLYIHVAIGDWATTSKRAKAHVFIVLSFCVSSSAEARASVRAFRGFIAEVCGYEQMDGLCGSCRGGARPCGLPFRQSEKRTGAGPG